MPVLRANAPIGHASHGLALSAKESVRKLAVARWNARASPARKFLAPRGGSFLRHRSRPTVGTGKSRVAARVPKSSLAGIFHLGRSGIRRSAIRGSEAALRRLESIASCLSPSRAAALGLSPPPPSSLSLSLSLSAIMTLTFEAIPAGSTVIREQVNAARNDGPLRNRCNARRRPSRCDSRRVRSRTVGLIGSDRHVAPIKPPIALCQCNVEAAFQCQRPTA